MSISVTPITLSGITDNPTEVAAGKIPPSAWNAGAVIKLAVAKLIGRATAGTGNLPAEEIAIGAGLTLDTTSLRPDKATAANIRAAAADKVLTADGIPLATAIVTLTFSATQAIDWNAGILFDVVATANITLANPTNVQVGTTRYIIIKGSSATALTVSFGTNFKGALPTDTVSSTSYLLIGMTAYSATHIVVTSCKAL